MGSKETPRFIPGSDPTTVGLHELRAGNFNDTAVTVQFYLPWIILFNGDSSAHTFTVTTRAIGGAPPNTFGISVPANSVQALPTLPISQIAIDTPTASAGWVYSDLPPPSAAGGSGGGGTATKLVTPAGWTIEDDGSGNLKILDPANNTEQLIYSALNGSGEQLAFLRNVKATATAGVGSPFIVATDNRQGLSAADGAPIDLIASANGTSYYRATVRIVMTGVPTSGTASYRLRWTEGGQQISKVQSVTSQGTQSSDSEVLLPDNGTAVTVQVSSAATMTSGGWNVTGLLERVI